MHGFKLADVEYFSVNDFMHPFIKRCYTFLRNFDDAKGVIAKYNQLGLSLSVGVFRNNKKGKVEYFINIFCNNHCVTGALTLASDNTDAYNDLLSLKPILVELVYTDDTGKHFERRVDVTESIVL